MIVKHLFDVKTWIIKALESGQMHEHSVPHCFKFILGEDGKVNMWYRKWSHNAWLGPLEILKVSKSNYTTPYHMLHAT